MSDNEVRRDERLAAILERASAEYRAGGHLDLAAWQAPGRIGRVALTPAGRYLFTSNSNGTVYVLRLGSTAATRD